MAALDDYARAGIQAINDRKYDAAIENFQKALAIDPNRPDINSALGMAYLHRGEAGSAIDHLEKAVKLAEPFDAPEHQEMKRHFHLGLATAYELLDRVGDAAGVLEGAVRRWPEDLQPRLQLGQVLLGSCRLEQGLQTYADLASHPALDDDGKEAAKAIVDAVRAFQESDNDPGVFLRGHAEMYRQYFDEVTKEHVEKGWYAEAARMARRGGEVVPMIPEGARPYAMQRVDVVNPENGEAASIYSEQEPMVVALNGLEPLAQIAIMLPWNVQSFETWVCTRSPWHWLPITVQFADADAPEKLVDAVDPVIGDWYLAGFNGDFGDKESGRFHFVTDPEPIGDRAVGYTVDLGRAGFEAIEALLRRLAILHEKRRIRRVLFGQGHLPD